MMHATIHHVQIEIIKFLQQRFQLGMCSEEIPLHFIVCSLTDFLFKGFVIHYFPFSHVWMFIAGILFLERAELTIFKIKYGQNGDRNIMCFSFLKAIFVSWMEFWLSFHEAIINVGKYEKVFHQARCSISVNLSCQPVCNNNRPWSIDTSKWIIFKQVHNMQLQGSQRGLRRICEVLK